MVNDILLNGMKKLFLVVDWNYEVTFSYTFRGYTKAQKLMSKCFNRICIIMLMFSVCVCVCVCVCPIATSVCLAKNLYWSLSMAALALGIVVESP